MELCNSVCKLTSYFLTDPNDQKIFHDIFPLKSAFRLRITLPEGLPLPAGVLSPQGSKDQETYLVPRRCSVVTTPA